MPRPGRLVLAHPRVLLGVLLGACLLVGAFLAVRDSSLVAVERIEITGATGPEGPRVRQALIETARDMTTLHVRQDALQDVVSPYATVRGLKVERHLLHGLTIHVLRRPAVAALSVDGQRLGVAADRTLLRGSPPPDDVPTLPLAAPPGGAKLTDARAVRALALVAAAPEAMRSHVRRVQPMRGGFRAELRDGPELVLGDASRLRAKWTAAARVLGDKDAKGATYVDVRLPERPVAGGLTEEQPSTTG